MHIPAKPTTAIADIAFDAALQSALREQEAYDVSRWLYVPPVYTDYRYILGTRGENPLICIGINPSTAAPDALDNTLKSVERIALNNGFDSFIMLNVYAQRATDPNDMERERNAAMHRENLAAFAYALSLSGNAPSVWAAWGTIVEKRPYLIGCMRDFFTASQGRSVRWLSAGALSKKGHPHHPLYLKKDTPLDAFDMAAYCGSFS